MDMDTELREADEAVLNAVNARSNEELEDITIGIIDAVNKSDAARVISHLAEDVIVMVIILLF